MEHVWITGVEVNLDPNRITENSYQQFLIGQKMAWNLITTRIKRIRKSWPRIPI